jgi:nitrite reductase (NO-forming)
MTKQIVGLDRPGSVAMDRRRAGRATERQVTALAIGLAAAFLALALISAVAPSNLGLGPWLPVHLLLAGAATTAIAGVMPFFTAAIANAPPAQGWLRLAAIVVVAIGALVVTGGRVVSPELVGRDAWLAAIGGSIFIIGLVLTAAATLLPLRFALGQPRLVMGAIYGMALLNVIAGATLATLLLFGWPPVIQDWGALKAAHAWLNVFGFVSLVIAGTLIHLLPTVAGTRINRTRAGVASYIGIAAGPPIAALGFIVGSDVIAMVGATVVVIGAVALAVYCLTVLRRRFAWTTDPSWHIFTIGSLTAAIGWFVIGTIVAWMEVVSSGARPSGWQLAPLVAPIMLGWIVQVLLGAATHLVPAVGPGLPPRHAAQRALLGRLGPARLALLNLGVLAVLLGDQLRISGLAIAGEAAVAMAIAAAVALVLAALAARDPDRSGATVGA